MKIFNLLFAAVLLTCVGLVFANSDHNLSSKSSEQYAHAKINRIITPTNCGGEVVDKLVDSLLITPMSDIVSKYDPHFFMSKCYNQIYFNANYDEQDKLKNETIVAGVTYLRGKMELSLCGNYITVAEVLLHCESKTFIFKITYDKSENKSDKFVDKATFLKDFEATFKKIR
jgi:hypothetical protein